MTRTTRCAILALAAQLWAPLVGCGQAATAGATSSAPVPFACGKSTCDGSIQYCLLSGTEGIAGSDVYACTPLPAACAGVPTCACVEAHGNGSMCSDPICTDGTVFLCNILN